MLPRDGVVALREAENEAKAHQRGVWAAYVPLPPPPICRTFDATVIEVISGDTIMVLENGSHVEKRVTFSSIRVPRQQAKGASSDPFAIQCKEFVRQKLIGKTVTVSLEYERASETGKDLRLFGTVLYGGKGSGNSRGRLHDIATQLVQEGLAVTVRHRGDEPRAAGYDMLLVEEVEAVQKKKGMHGPQAKASATGVTQKNDISTDAKRAKAVFATLSKDKTYKGQIDHVFTASRFKVTIPSENVTIQLALSQVRTPLIAKTNPSNSDEDGNDTLEEGEVKEDPLAKWIEEGKRFSRHNYLQRKVDIEISDIDRNGIMMGKIHTHGDNNRTKPVAFALVERGLASVDKYAQRRGGQEIMTLLDIQNDAQREKRGMWIVPNAIPEPSKDDDEENDDMDGESSNEAGKSMFRVNLTEIYDGANFAVNFVDQPNDSDNALLRGQMKLSELEEMMASFAKNAANEEALLTPSKGMLLAALDVDPSCDDGQSDERAWLRAYVEDTLDDKRVRLTFIDYGHGATVSVNDLRELPPPLQHYAPQAVPCTLSFLRAEGVNTEGGLAAAQALNSLAWGKACLIKVHGRERGANLAGGKSGGDATSALWPPPKLEVSLYAVDSYSEEDLSHATNVGVKLVRHGFIRISATLARKERGLSRRRRGGNKTVAHVATTNETLHELEVAQELAYNEHLRMWVYGHPGDSDDEDVKDEKSDEKKK
jgi:staphylococcal nuclease domain-containing protein 1